jgi:hypothetical protein
MNDDAALRVLLGHLLSIADGEDARSIRRTIQRLLGVRKWQHALELLTELGIRKEVTTR